MKKQTIFNISLVVFIIILAGFVGFQTFKLNELYWNNAPVGFAGGTGGLSWGGRVLLNTAGTSYITASPDEFLYIYSAGIKELEVGQNTALGYQAGGGGAFNTSIGFQAGVSLTVQAQYNVFVGTLAGNGLRTGTENVMIGYYSGFQTDNAEDNVFVGVDAGEKNLTGGYNVFLGAYVANSNSIGKNKIAIGYRALNTATSDDGNVAVGYKAGYLNESATGDVFLGFKAGYSATGMRNTFLGYEAGYSNATGTGDVFLGFQAGYSETGSNKLYIDNSSTDTPLIYGDFSTNALTVNGTLAVGSSTGVQASATSGVLTLAGIGNTNNENLTLDFESVADNVKIGTTTGATLLDFNALNLKTTGGVGVGITNDGTSFPLYVYGENKTAGLYVNYKTTTANSDSKYGLFFYHLAYGNTGTLSSMFGVFGYLEKYQGSALLNGAASYAIARQSGSGAITQFDGYLSYMWVSSGGTGVIANATGYRFFANNQVGTINNLSGFYYTNPTNTATIDTNYGLYLEKATSATTNWQIYSVGGNSAFGGNTSFNKLTVPSYAIDASGDVSLTGLLRLPYAPVSTTPANGSLTASGDGILRFYSGGKWYKIATSEF